jgi:C4-dicarboxylate transporter
MNLITMILIVIGVLIPKFLFMNYFSHVSAKQKYKQLSNWKSKYKVWYPIFLMNRYIFILIDILTVLLLSVENLHNEIETVTI